MRLQRPHLLLATLLLWGCSDDNGGADTGLPDVGVTDTLPDKGDQGPQPDAPITSEFCGQLVDTTGANVAGGDVIVCNDVECNTGTADGSGAVCVQVIKLGDYLFHATEREAAGKHLGDVMFPVALSAAEVGTKVDLGTVTMPLLGAKVKLDPQSGGTLDLGGGAKLTVPAGATVLPPLSTEADVAFAALDTAMLHSKLVAALPGGKSPQAAFVIVPVGVSFTTPISFELPGPSALAVGTVLEIYRVHNETGKLELKGEAKVDSSDKLVNEAGKGLSALGVLVLVEK